MRDERGRKVHERQVVARFDFPADEQRAKAIVPAVRPLDDPPSRATVDPSEQRRLPFLPNVWRDAPAADRRVAVAERIPLVETTMLRPAHSAPFLEHHGIERRRQRPFIVEVGAT